MARIFICGDTGQTALLDQTAARLATHGHRIVRGDPDTPGVLRRYSEAEIATLIAPADLAIFTTRHDCSRTVLQGGRSLRGICYPVTGVETLDLQAATELGIIVGHGAVSENVTGMAEATLMLILMLLYQVESNIARMRALAWRPPVTSSRQLAGKTIGMIGCGRIARALSALLRPFGVRQLTYSPSTKIESVPAGMAITDLETLLRESDAIVVLATLSAETRHLLGASGLMLMKPHSVLVNTGRGEIVDEAALAEALTARRIHGAALDTFAVEPLPAESPLRLLDNVILTPHCVGHTVEGVAAIAPTLLENVQRILRGEIPLICKNPQCEPAWRQRLKTQELFCRS